MCWFNHGLVIRHIYIVHLTAQIQLVVPSLYEIQCENLRPWQKKVHFAEIYDYVTGFTLT